MSASEESRNVQAQSKARRCLQQTAAVHESGPANGLVLLAIFRSQVTHNVTKDCVRHDLLGGT
ncbi:MAG: hypothetical protein L0H57_12430, partial [Yaniella sp.]|nr:hypothetical protein [Yaniella sp.]